ncbi:hemin-degrading factor [Phyllobacterium leguminum]|uniref:Putative hemin transport protein n=1 Tax=Phyllobacterium leguminum TaxID=314237 RepID=A0A318SZM8_9HYPH|nr:ChuX/HutX family heme-like substrate-binding protein [Phyllobacterium leguminum]PYE86876.1 putative hemin transport protein [Phyllobacterium leguminum]
MTDNSKPSSNPKPSPEEILVARAENPKLREREFAQLLNISEADYVAAQCGDAVIRIRPDVDALLSGIEAVGEVMALTRNESAVHEKIGVYENIKRGEHAALVLGAEIDLRTFPKVWAHGFAVEKRDGDDVRRSLQFFDKAGEAVHKIHLRPASDLNAYYALVETMRSDDQSRSIETVAYGAKDYINVEELNRDDFRNRWSQMTDVHQFVGLLKDFKLNRHQAVNVIGEEYAWTLDIQAVETMMNAAAEAALPIMCFVGNRGCIQIHSGPIAELKTVGPWLNVLDPTFHLHLRADHIREVWGVRKPSKDGHVTSLEAYDANGEMIIQFFGKRHEGEHEREDWRALVESLPRVRQSTAA